jgi:hypothetical protein
MVGFDVTVKVAYEQEEEGGGGGRTPGAGSNPGIPRISQVFSI